MSTIILVDSRPTFIIGQRKKKKKKKNLALSTVGFCPPLNKLLKNKDKKINLWTARGQQTHFCTVEVMHSI
jgi:hypothetical protein